MNGTIGFKSRDYIRRIGECGQIIHNLFFEIEKMELAGITTWELHSPMDYYILNLKGRVVFKTI